jgi:hypothetical protein
VWVSSNTATRRLVKRFGWEQPPLAIFMTLLFK